MYLNNTKKLFDDLYAIPTMYDYMVACAEDGMQDDLENLISIVKYNQGELHEGGEGSLRWDLEEYEYDEQARQQVIKDARTMTRIWLIIQKELRSKYVMVCDNCGATAFYTRRPKYDVDNYYCGKCKSEHLTLYTFEEWFSSKGVNYAKI